MTKKATQQKNPRCKKITQQKTIAARKSLSKKKPRCKKITRKKDSVAEKNMVNIPTEQELHLSASDKIAEFGGGIFDI